MPQEFAKYRLAGHRFVQGWLAPEILDIVQALDSAQRANGISGSVAEIGVHHGKFLIALHLLRRESEHALAIDVFADQHLNRDGSGQGDLDTFLANMHRWTSIDGVVIHQGDSTLLDSATAIELAESRCRFFSVDGGHTEEVVFSDMNLAEATLADGGIVIADDVFHERWPGVAVGTLRYLQSGGKLAPFAIGFNKVFFAQPAYADTYRHAIEDRCRNAIRISTQTSTYAGHPVALVFPTPRTPRQLLRKNATARTIYRALARPGALRK
ncbi:class I SAM-dependent methyltransferase [Mycobacterium sp. M1]|uniref:Class I SAM-dependent methyltransferase n=1 Tax=Mycolicibacter acidiphilus TaxID=2835306 RepID=A0ABS5RKR1_9MYCO|nr:class I SAM-dependent methyltransferase [Mycolicibacter acidiphilus]MBS9533509.1 class I SAM-dependent methyltransferase [Mycolicibacter acidiphilus]